MLLAFVSAVFTASDVRLPFSSPPTTRRVTVEVSDLASTRGKSEYPDFYPLFILEASVIGSRITEHCTVTHGG
jgi:hypothetical protein